MSKVKYTGPDGLYSNDVALHSSKSGELVPGEVYDVPADLASRLVETTPHFVHVKAPKASPSKRKPSDPKPAVAPPAAEPTEELSE